MPPPSPTIRKALVIDDESVARNTLTIQLRGAGIRDVQAAADWNAAKALLEGERDFDLVVTDVDMPGAEGPAFLEHLGQIPGVSVLVLSALDPLVLRSVEKLARAAGVRLLGVRAKPLLARDLATLLTAAAPDR